MADKFNPRGAPVPQNPYDGWDLTHQPAMLPFLAEYTNAQGDKAGGWAMPTMVEEPINALSRLLNTPAGTMPDPQDPQNRQDALTGLLSLYGGNAVGGVARNAMSRGIAMGRPNMEAARPVAYSNGIDAAMSNPNMLSMMRDIDYANLNRRALDDYGVGYEGLSSSQEAALRGWSDPSTSADAGRMGVMDYGKAAYLTARHPFEKTTADLSDPIAIWDQFHFSPKEGGDLQNFPYWTDEGNIFTNYPLHGEDTFAGRSGPNRLSNDRGVPGDVEAYRGRPATSLDVIDGGLLSDTGKPNPVGAGVASKSNPLDDIDLEALLAEVKGVKNIPEPEVKGSRGAQGVQKQNADAMGFDTEKVWYRGMRRPYEDNWPEQGYNYQMFTDNFKDAGGYAGEWHQPNIMPVHVKPGNALELNAGGSNFNFVSTEGLPQEIRSKLGGTASIDQIAHAAKDAGYDSLTVNNVFDKPGEARTGKPNAVHVALKPQNIRSVNAAFDPAKADSSFLLASDTGRPNPLGAALTSDNQENSLMDILKKYGIR